MNSQNPFGIIGKARYICSLALAAVALLAAGEAQAASFVFTSIADTSNTLGQSNTYYSGINRGLGTSGGFIDPYAGARPPVYDLYNYTLQNDPLYQAGKGIAMSNGNVAYIAQKNPGTGTPYQVINFGSGGIPTLIASTTIGSEFSSFGQGIAINKNKEVAFVSTLSSTGETKVFLKKPGLSPPQAIASVK